ncbi:MAG: glycosyltransferase family 39 protein [candidate division WWE3 bacterium]|nr:glycosyltransferase family 39 protein [candidate division WWE3 bacterium]
MRNLPRFLRTHWPLILAITVTISTLYIYWEAKPTTADCYDCDEYQNLADFISRDTKNIISDYRPPLYPIFLILNGLSVPNSSGSLTLFISQSLILLLTLCLFWNLIVKLKMPTRINWIPIILLAITPAFYSFTKFKMTEVVNLFLLALLVTVALKLKYKLTLRGILAFVIIIATATFTRFANCYLGILILLLIAASHGRELFRKRNIVLIALAVFLVVVPQVIYSSLNYHRNYYFGLSGETGVNLIGKLVQYNLVPQADPEFPTITKKLAECKGTRRTIDVFTCIWDFLPKNSFVSKYSVDNQFVDAFDRKYILRNLPSYIASSIPVVVEAMGKPANSYLVLSETTSPLFELEKKIASIYHKILLVWLITGFPLFFICYRKLFLKEIELLLFIVVSSYYVAITGLAAINDYQRIVMPAIPFLDILLVYSMYHLARLFLKKNYYVSKT